MAEDLQGGKPADASPAPAAAGSQTPDNSGGSTGGSPSPSTDQTQGQQRSEFIPRERFDQVLETTRALEAKVAELEGKTRQQTSGQRTWEQIPEQDLNYIVTHSGEYPDHAPAALAEIRRRDRSALKSEIMGEVGVSELRSGNSEAFDPGTPLGKEVAKIMTQNRPQKEILSDVIELAKYRIGGNNNASSARTKLVQNMQSASVLAPGSDNQTQTAPPSFMSMPKDDFRKYVESIKLGEFKK